MMDVTTDVFGDDETSSSSSSDDADDMNVVDRMLAVFNGSEKTVNQHSILEPALLVLTGAVMVWLLTSLLLKCRNNKANSDYTELADSRV